MRAGLFALGFLTLGLAGCPSGGYGDSGADRPPLPQQNFDLDNTGNAVCPGQLFGAASERRASCSAAPQRCVSQTSGMTQRIVCSCTGSDGGMGSWTCQQENP